MGGGSSIFTGMTTSLPDARDKPVTPPLPRVPRTFHIMTKPIGPICNLDCTYCFYLEKEKLYPGSHDFKMTDATLENYVRQYIAQQDSAEISFAWQGGEPTLMGLDFFKRVVELQAKHCPPGKRVSNALQTNGTLLDEDWCAFFKQHGFLIGLSVDGPKELHDRYRVNKGGRGTHDQVMRAWQMLQGHRVEFNTLTVVNKEVGEHPSEVYGFLKEHGAEFMQFIPLVERLGSAENTAQRGAEGLAEPPLLKVLTPHHEVTRWSVRPLQYGVFLQTIFDQWVRHDVGRVFIQLFDVQLGIEMGLPAGLCVFAETCGKALAMEHNGDLYACDHFVYDGFKLGNISEKSIAEMVESQQQRQFGLDKRDTLPNYCKTCSVRQHCNGECPKHRFLLTPDGEPGLNYLCAGYKHFFGHIKPYLRTMADLIRAGRAPAEIMGILAQREGRVVAVQQMTPMLHNRVMGTNRNDLCPCGSGKKFKKCCGR